MKAACFKLTCHEKLAWSPQALSFCHCQYVLWRSFGERNSFLDKNTQKKPQGKKQRLYFVQQRNCDRFRVCSTSKWCDSREVFQFVTSVLRTSSKLRVTILSLNEKGWIKAFLGTPQKPKREPNTPVPSELLKGEKKMRCSRGCIW